MSLCTQWYTDPAVNHRNNPESLECIQRHQVLVCRYAYAYMRQPTSTENGVYRVKWYKFTPEEILSLFRLLQVGFSLPKVISFPCCTQVNFQNINFKPGINLFEPNSLQPTKTLTKKKQL